MKRTLSDSARAAMKAGALARGKTREQQIISAVEQAMATIKTQIDANDGVYPKNGGTVNRAEIIKIANVSNVIFTPKYETLHQTITLWLDSLQNKVPIRRVAVRRTLAERLADSKLAYKQLESNYLLTWAQLQEEQRIRQETEEKVKHLELRLSTIAKSSPSRLHPTSS